MKVGDTNKSYKSVTINSVGMVSSIGLSAASSCAAARANISHFQEIPFHDTNRRPIVGAPVSEAVPNRQGFRRIAPLISKAIHECITEPEILSPSIIEQIPLLVAIDNLQRPDYPQDLPLYLLEEIQSILKLNFCKHSKVFHGGKTAFFRALEQADRFLKNSAIERCIIAAGDSLLNSRALKWLENNYRLKTEDNSDGIIPGEAAAAIQVTRSVEIPSSIIDIIGLGFGVETSAEKNTPNLATGLADAFRNALANADVSLHEIDFRVGGMTGERLEFMEASTASARVQRIHRDNFQLWVPAEKLGDIGAALPACMMVITAIAIKKKYAPGNSAILYCSSSSTERAACVVASSSGV